MSGAQTVTGRIAQAEAVSLLLAGSLCLLPFLLPYHLLPIPSFQAEWLAAALGSSSAPAPRAGGRTMRGACAYPGDIAQRLPATRCDAYHRHVLDAGKSRG